MNQTKKLLFILMIVFSFFSTFLVSYGQAFWPFGENKDQLIKKLEHDLQSSEQKLQSFEQKLQLSEQKSAYADSRYHLLIGVTVAVALIFLIIGAAMMAKTRKDKKAQYNAVRRNYDD